MIFTLLTYLRDNVLLKATYFHCSCELLTMAIFKGKRIILLIYFQREQYYFVNCQVARSLVNADSNVIMQRLKRMM